MTAITAIKTIDEYSSLVPQLSAEEYESLKESIKQNGLWTPIVVNKDGIILDGHHRYKACQELGIKIKEPNTVTKEFKDKLEETLFVIDCNLTRRHLNNYQRTELALKSKSILDGIAKQNESLGGKMKGDRNLTPLGRVDEQIGQRAGVSRDTVRKVETIVQKAPERVLQGLRTGDISINQAFEEYGRGHRAFAEVEHRMFRDLRLELMPTFAEMFEVGRKQGKTDEEIEADIRKMEDESDKDILNDESMKNGTESYRECVKGIVCGLKEIREDCIKAAKNLADRAARVTEFFQLFGNLEKQGKDLSPTVGFRHDRFIMTVEDVKSYNDIDERESGLVHTFKDKRNILFDVYTTTENYAYVRAYNCKQATTLPDVKTYVPGEDYGFVLKTRRDEDNNEEQQQHQQQQEPGQEQQEQEEGEKEYLKLDDAQADFERNYYADMGLYVLERDEDDDEAYRILGFRDKPSDPRIIDYQVLYESPKCIEQKEDYSSGEMVISKRPIES